MIKASYNYVNPCWMNWMKRYKLDIDKIEKIIIQIENMIFLKYLKKSRVC